MGHCQKLHDNVLTGHCDMFLVDEDFGCVLFEVGKNQMAS